MAQIHKRFTIAESMNISFDHNTDTLYIRMGKSRRSIARDVGNGVLIQYNSISKKPIGAVIHDFSHRFSEKEKPIQIPLSNLKLQSA